MLQQPGRERQNQVITTLMFFLESVMPILILGVLPSEMGPRPTGRRLPTWGVSSCPTMFGIPMQLQGAYATSQPLYAINHCIL